MTKSLNKGVWVGVRPKKSVRKDDVIFEQALIGNRDSKYNDGVYFFRIDENVWIRIPFGGNTRVEIVFEKNTLLTIIVDKNTRKIQKLSIF